MISLSEDYESYASGLRFLNGMKRIFLNLWFENIHGSGDSYAG